MARPSKHEDSETASVLQTPVAIEAGATLPINVTVLRVSGPWVQVNFAGQVVHLLRSRLEKEID